MWNSSSSRIHSAAAGDDMFHRESEFFFPPSPQSSPTVCFNARMALLDGCCLLLRLRVLWTAFLHPQLGALHPCGPSGMVRSRRTCHCHSGGDGSRSVSAEGWREAEEGGGEAEKEGFIHCLPLQCGGCCCSGDTPGTPSQSFSPS